MTEVKCPRCDRDVTSIDMSLGRPTRYYHGMDYHEDLTADLDIYASQRWCPSCGTRCDRDPYDIGSGPEFSCHRCETCWGALGQPLDPDDPRRVPQEVLDKLPEWARSSFIPIPPPVDAP